MPPANCIFTPKADGQPRGIHHSKENGALVGWHRRGERRGVGGVEVSPVQQVIGTGARPSRSRQPRPSNVDSFIGFELMR